MIVEDERDAHHLHRHAADYDQVEEPEAPATRIPASMSDFLANRARV